MIFVCLSQGVAIFVADYLYMAGDNNFDLL